MISDRDLDVTLKTLTALVLRLQGRSHTAAQLALMADMLEANANQSPDPQVTLAQAQLYRTALSSAAEGEQLVKLALAPALRE